MKKETPTGFRCFKGTQARPGGFGPLKLTILDFELLNIYKPRFAPNIITAGGYLSHGPHSFCSRIRGTRRSHVRPHNEVVFSRFSGTDPRRVEHTLHSPQSVQPQRTRTGQIVCVVVVLHKLPIGCGARVDAPPSAGVVLGVVEPPPAGHTTMLWAGDWAALSGHATEALSAS